MRESDQQFPSARHDLETAKAGTDRPQTCSASYRLAYDDTEFMLRDELRGVRLELELLKADLMLEDAGIHSTIVVFGSARAPSPDGGRAGKPDPRIQDYEAARHFARLVAEQPPIDGLRFVVATGGGGGVMEAANRGAHEAGHPTVGFNIVIKTEQVPNPYITPELCFQFHYFGLRKMHLLMRTKALVCFPGGFGTMDELFETLTLIQTGKIAPLPVLLYRPEWWRRMINFEMFVEDGMISPEDLEIFHFVETAEEAWQAIHDFYAEDRPGQPPIWL